MLKLFPAHAGVILTLEPLMGNSRTIPRTRGGDPNIIMRIDVLVIYSPHTRG